jgi:hypothetical protein
VKLTVPILFTACAMGGCVPFGPRDGYLKVTGVAPATGVADCWVAVEQIGGSGSDRRVKVSGQFEAPFVVSPNRSGHKAVLSCGRQVVSSRTFKYGRDVDIGGSVVLPGTAP